MNPLVSALDLYVLGAALTGLWLLGRANTRQQTAEVALTALLWPLYAAVVGGCSFIALCAILIFWPFWLIALVRGACYRRRK